MTQFVLKEYPYWSAEKPMDVQQQLRDITRTRKDDISQFKALPDYLISGRSVNRIPSSSADVVATDRVGDISRDALHTYVLQNPASPAWVRYTGASF